MNIYIPSFKKVNLYTNSGNSNDVKMLKEKYKIEIIGKLPNSIYLHPDFKTIIMVKLVLKGTGNEIYIGKPLSKVSRVCQLKLHAEFHQNNSTLIIADQHEWPIKLSIISYDNNQTIIWGKGATSNGTSITVQHPNSIVAIGDDCMFAADTWIRNTDMHGIYDLSTKKKLNKPGNVIIQPHVWIGQYAYLVGNVSIGYATAVGVQSLVKGNLEPCSIYAGSPVKKIKANTTWNREPNDELPEKILELIEKCKLHF